ncbi:MAG: alpha/beta fold hydrolase [Flavobacteriales bacterium]
MSKLEAQSNPSDTPYPESRFSVVNGVRYHYRCFSPEERGEPKGTLLLVHGFASSTFSWRKLFSPLTREGYKVIAVDIPPFGFSDRSPDIDHSAPARARQLWKLLEKEGVEKPHLVGHSMGARVVGSMGALHPHRCGTVFLVDGPFFGTRKYGLPRMLGAALFNNRPVRVLLERLGSRLVRKPKLVKRILSFVYGQEAGKEAVEGYIRPLRLEGTAYSLPPYFLEQASEELSMGALKTKVHLIWGEKDQIFPERMPERFLKRFPYKASISVIKGAGHCPMETHPEEFLDAVFSQLKKGNSGPVSAP